MSILGKFSKPSSGIFTDTPVLAHWPRPKLKDTSLPLLVCVIYFITIKSIIYSPSCPVTEDSPVLFTLLGTLVGSNDSSHKGMVSSPLLLRCPSDY